MKSSDAFQKNKDVKTASSYVGEKECASCHTMQSHSLVNTLHPKIFKPVTSQHVSHQKITIT